MAKKDREEIPETKEVKGYQYFNKDHKYFSDGYVTLASKKEELVKSKEEKSE